MSMRKSESEKCRAYLKKEYERALKCRYTNAQYMYKRIAELADPDYLRGWPKYLHEYALGYYDAFWSIMGTLCEDSQELKDRYLEQMLTCKD